MENVCQNCRHFKQHYIKINRRFSAIEDGHCVYPRLKDRRPGTKACDHYSEKKSANEK